MPGNKAQKLDFKSQECRPGVDRADWHGGPFTAVKYVYAPGSVFPSHKHDAAQITVLLKGKIIFDVEGVEFTLENLEALYIPGAASHGARVPEDSEPAVSINIFNPPRKEHP